MDYQGLVDDMRGLKSRFYFEKMSSLTKKSTIFTKIHTADMYRKDSDLYNHDRRASLMSTITNSYFKDNR